MTSLSSKLQQQRAAAAEEFSRGTDGVKSCTSLTLAMDSAVRQAFADFDNSAKDGVAIIALGGYGRAEMFPHSDVDVMVLSSAGGGVQVEGSAREFLHSLWDAGLNIGHSVRTINETIAQHGASLDSWVSVLESRFICGNAELADKMYSTIREKIVKGNKAWYISSLFDEALSRQMRFGNSVKLLEPNVKKSTGGLRDLQTVFWLHRGIEHDLLTPLNPEVPATLAFLDQLKAESSIDEEMHSAAVAALRFMFSVRTAMHLKRDGPHDTLEYSLQREVAEFLGCRSQSPMHPVEVFMRDYYLHARTIHMLFTQLGQRFRETIEPVRRAWNKGSRVGSTFRVRDGVLLLDPPVQRLTAPETVFEAFALAATEEVDFDAGLRAALYRSADLVAADSAPTPEAIAMTRKVLTSRRVADTLRDMNDTNILGKLIPEFADLVAFFQHNMYHYYTADEHTLVALEFAEHLREKQGPLREVFRNLRRKELLYLSILLHDIAKPRGVADHEITGVPIAEEVTRRLGFPDLAADVGFLVRHHLVMEQVTFRRNINDPETLKEFARHFERPYLLDYLYILTYADLSAVNPGIWTEWKGAMLQELYHRTSEVLNRNLKGEEVDRYHEERREQLAQKIERALHGQMTPAVLQKHLKGIPNASYADVFSPEEIAGHIAAAESLDLVAARFADMGGSTDVTLIARDAPGTLSRFCGVLSANDATIFSADVFTRSDGIVIDRFRVSDAAEGGKLSQRACTKITEDLRKVISGELDIRRLFEDHQRKWKRRPKRPDNPNIRTDVRFEDAPRNTIIDVYAADRVGFLFEVTGAMAALGLNITYAKIATRVDGIVDAFYVQESDGKAVKGQERKDEIRQAILSTIETVDHE
jgi:[protein-PII] uridylyltransferase